MKPIIKQPILIWTYRIFNDTTIDLNDDSVVIFCENGHYKEVKKQS